MSEETARLLIEATNRLSSVIERLGGLGAGGGGIHIYHHNVSPVGQHPAYPNWLPPSSLGGTAGGNG